MSSSGGGIVVHAQDAPHTHFSKDEVQEIVNALPDGDLKSKWQAILDSLT